MAMVVVVKGNGREAFSVKGNGREGFPVNGNAREGFPVNFNVTVLHQNLINTIKHCSIEWNTVLYLARNSECAASEPDQHHKTLFYSMEQCYTTRNSDCATSEPDH